MTDHGDNCPAAATLAGTAVHSSCCPTEFNNNRRWLERVRFDSTGFRELLRNPHTSVGDRITSQHDPIGGCYVSKHPDHNWLDRDHAPLGRDQAELVGAAAERSRR